MPPDKRKYYPQIIEEFVTQHGNKILASLQPEHLQRLLARQEAFTDAGTANRWLKAIQALCRFGARWEMRQYHHAIHYMAPLEEEIIEPQKLYVIRAAGSGLFKIGISKHPQSRLREMQVGSPAELKIVSVTAIESSDADRQAHRVLEPYRSHGEWFDFGPLADYVAGRLQREPSNIDALLAVLREISNIVVPAFSPVTTTTESAR